MKTITLILAIIISFGGQLKSQSEKLDEKNGFKDIKLGDSFEKWQADLVFQQNNKDNEKLYLYKGSCCQDVFGKPVEYIEIVIANNKIICIGITLKPYQDNRPNGIAKFRYPNEDFTRLTLDFKSLFGEPKDGAPNETIGKYYSKIWEGSKVVLIADYYFKGNYDYSKVVVFDKIYYAQQKEKGF